MIQFFVPMIPPNKTHQEKGERVVNGRIVHYTKDEVKAIRQRFLAELADHAPAAPFTGPVRLVTKWMYPAGYGCKPGQWKNTKPDTDNLIKLFKDCMADVGFFKDDAQVASEITEKFYWDLPGIYVRVEELSYGPEPH